MVMNIVTQETYNKLTGSVYAGSYASRYVFPGMQNSNQKCRPKNDHQGIQKARCIDIAYRCNGLCYFSISRASGCFRQGLVTIPAFFIKPGASAF